MSQLHLTQAALRADFHAACTASPQLKPLQALLELVEADKLDNINLFCLLWSTIQNDAELKAAYQKDVDPEMDRAARILVAENPPSPQHIKFFSNLAHEFEDKIKSLEGAQTKGNFFTRLAHEVHSMFSSKSMHAREATAQISTIRKPLAESVVKDHTTSASNYNDTGRITSKHEPPHAPSTHFAEFVSHFRANCSTFSQVLEGDGKPMTHYPLLPFNNWGLTVGNTPTDTFSARTKVGVCNLIKWAKRVGKSVRCTGFRHSWSDIFSDNSQILLMLLPLHISEDLHTFRYSGDSKSDLDGVQVVDNAEGLVKVGAGTTNDQFRMWCLKEKRLCLPLNVIMVEITFGGSNAPICHGAGLQTYTLSDIVAEVEYVDALGEIQTVSDPAELRAAAGSFGLLGIVVSLTLRLNKMQMAEMKPMKVPIALAIPPPKDYPIPEAMKPEVSKYSQKELDDALLKFKETVETDYYLEWFWFPYSSEVWVNTWKKVDIPNGKVLDPYPSNFQAALQWVEGFMGQLITNWWAFQLLPARLQAWLLGTITMFQMPAVKEGNTIDTYVSEALHFRRGIQNMRVRDTEWEIPFPALEGTDNERDYSIIQRAWWDTLSAFYSSDKPAMRLTLELRITGSSNIIMAPQRYNDLGTISIEVLTPMSTPTSDWEIFVKQVVKDWTSYRLAGGKGELLKVRPHWAKQWQGLTVRDMDVMDYLRNVAYHDERGEFVEALKAIVDRRSGKAAWEETRKRFHNPLLEKVFFV